MLVLSRKINESIVVAGNIRVTLLTIHGQTARLGIEAPAEVLVLREELRTRCRETRACTEGRPARSS
jgi:carbon storage regulator